MRTTVNIFCAEELAAAEAPGPSGAEADRSTPSLSGAIGDAVLDLQSLFDIADDTGGYALALQFLQDFFGLLQVRLSRLLAALVAEEPEASVDAVLSLQTAAAMAGATEIAERCGTILPLVVARNFAAARVPAAALQHGVEVLTAASPMLLEQAGARLGAKAAATKRNRNAVQNLRPKPLMLSQGHSRAVSGAERGETWCGTESGESLRPGCRAKPCAGKHPCGTLEERMLN